MGSGRSSRATAIRRSITWRGSRRSAELPARNIARWRRPLSSHRAPGWFIEASLPKSVALSGAYRLLTRDDASSPTPQSSLRPRLRSAAAIGAGAEVVEHEQANRRRQIALLAIAVDFADQLRQRHVARAGDLLHAVPEGLFEAEAGLVAGDDDRTFDDGRLHDASP